MSDLVVRKTGHNHHRDRSPLYADMYNGSRCMADLIGPLTEHFGRPLQREITATVNTKLECLFGWCWPYSLE